MLAAACHDIYSPLSHLQGEPCPAAEQRIPQQASSVMIMVHRQGLILKHAGIKSQILRPEWRSGAYTIIVKSNIEPTGSEFQHERSTLEVTRRLPVPAWDGVSMQSPLGKNGTPAREIEVSWPRYVGGERLRPTLSCSRSQERS